MRRFAPLVPRWSFFVIGIACLLSVGVLRAQAQPPPIPQSQANGFVTGTIAMSDSLWL